MKKILSVVSDVLTALLTLFAVFVTVFTLFTVRADGQNGVSLFGWLPCIVLSDSMQDTFQSGDVILVRQTPAGQIQPGDIIAFTSIDPANQGEIVTHKVRSVNADGSFTTYGTFTGQDDAYSALPEHLLGRYRFRLPGLGRFFQYLKTPQGYVTLVLIPFLGVIFVQAVHFWYALHKLRRMDKQDQRRALEAERRKSAAMQAELDRLRAEKPPQ